MPNQMQTRGGISTKKNNNRRIKSKEKEKEKETALPDIQTGEKRYYNEC
jgi:hypothetical protein